MSTSVAGLSGNFFPSAENGFTTTTSGSVSSGAATVGLNSVAGYSNGEVAVFVIDPTDASKKQTFTGVIDTAGSQVTNVVWTAGTNQSHALGATVVDYATATHISMMTKGLLVQHKQDGTHADTITTNTVNENTAANGVTIDGLNIKDSKLNTDDSVLPKHLATGTGTSWVWQSYTPTWTNLTVGNGTANFKYTQIGKTVFVRGTLVIGSTSSISGVVSMSTPITIATGYSSESLHMGSASFLDSGSALYAGWVSHKDTSSVYFLAANAAGTYLVVSSANRMSNTVPFGFATNDALYVNFCYEAA